MNVKKLLLDIRFWIVVLFVIRGIGISNPPIEVGHNWRQTIVAMVARNFSEVDNNIMLPRIDIAGEKTGITGMEFPVFNYLIYISNEIFGYQHWYGRLINLLFSSLGLWFFYKLLKKYFTEAVCFNATIILACSIWFQFSRKIMPDTFSMSLLIASIYYGTNYLESKKGLPKLLNLFIYVALMALGSLAKLSSAYILFVFVFLILDKQISPKLKIIFSLVSALGFLPVLFWYAIWVPHMVETYGFWHFYMGKSFAEGFDDILSNLPATFKRFYDTALKFIGFGAFLFGLGYALIKKDKKITTLFFLALLCFSSFIFKAGFNFHHHNYYIIPFVPIMALVAGYGLSKISNSNIAILLLIAISIEGIANQQHDFKLKKDEIKILHLEAALDKISNSNDLIIINSGQFPTPMYFAHRKGWVQTNEYINNPSEMNQLVPLGLKYIVILKTTLGTDVTLNQYEKILDNETYSIYKASIIDE